MIFLFVSRKKNRWQPAQVENLPSWCLNPGETVVFCLSTNCFSFSPSFWNDTAMPPTSSFHPHLHAARLPLPVLLPLPSGIYCISFFLHLFSRTFHQDTNDCWENSSAPPVCFVVQLPGFSSQSHYWLLLNTRKLRCNQGELHRVLVLLYFFIP